MFREKVRSFVVYVCTHPLCAAACVAGFSLGALAGLGYHIKIHSHRNIYGRE